MWWKAGNQAPVKEVNQLSFQAIAVVAAMNVDGELISFLVKDFSIKKEDFVEFLDITFQKTGGCQSYIFLDNLRAHYSKIVASAS